MKINECQDENIIVKRVIGSHQMRLSVDRHGRAVLRIPFLCPRGIAMKFLENHQEWLENQKEKRKAQLTFREGMTVSVLGEAVVIRHREGTQKTCISGKELWVSGDVEFLNRRVCDFIKKQTALYIDEKARELAGKINKKINRISMKDTVSRWGSCSGKGNLNFCWRLGLAPRFVLDYIIAHEVAHLQEMNHSERFWRVVGQLCDRRSDAEIWLRRHGSSLR